MVEVRLIHGLADLVDLYGAHALVVNLHIEAADLETGEVAHQEAVDAHTVERADIAGDQRPPLVIGEIEARQRLGRIGLHGGAEGVVAQHLATQIVDGEDRHDALSFFCGPAVVSLLENIWSEDFQRACVGPTCPNSRVDVKGQFFAMIQSRAATSQLRRECELPQELAPEPTSEDKARSLRRYRR